MLEVLKKAINSESARMREGQAEALYAMWKGTGDLLLALPTGAGKNLLYCLLALLCPDKIVIVVVPLKVLMGDMVRRCQHYGVTTNTWEDVRLRLPAVSLMPFRGIVLVQAEHVNASEFEGFVAQLLTYESKLHAVILDESHIWITQGSSFRRGLPRGLERLPACVRRIAATATAPPLVVERLEYYMLSGRSFTSVLRRVSLPAHLRFEVRIS